METRNSQDTITNCSLDSSFASSANASAVSWSAIFAGATAATAISLILLFLGTGLGLTVVSPWAYKGMSGTAFGVSTILWFTSMSLIASGLGGYITGRLRTRWLATHSDEVYFRDTAHGFLAWGIATLVTATLVTSVISSVVSGVAQTGATVGGAAALSDVDESETDKSLPYFLDSLFRENISASPSVTEVGSEDDRNASKAEMRRIFLNALSNQTLPPADLSYASQRLAQRTGISQQEAETRIKDIFTKLRGAEDAARVAADKARKATAYSSLWLFISLLAGAFLACCSAIFGGRQRDL